MKEQCISFETSKLAKEKGFPDYECTRYYLADGSIVSANWVDIYEPKEYYPIVSQSLLQKWLRDEHKLHIEVQWYDDDEFAGFLVGKNFESNEYTYDSSDAKSMVYEEVIDKCLLMGLSEIKKA